MKGSGKQKGAGFEREVCKQLSLWITKGQEKTCFWRSAMSGGRATLIYVNEGGEAAANQAGDISAISIEGMELINKCYIECKNYSNLRIDSSLLNRKGELAKFWFETKRQAVKYKKYAVLIAKQNYLPVMLWCETGCDLFGDPIIIVPLWDAKCYLFYTITAFPKHRVRL